MCLSDISIEEVDAIYRDFKARNVPMALPPSRLEFGYTFVALTGTASACARRIPAESRSCNLGIENYVAPSSFYSRFPGEAQYWSNVHCDGPMRQAMQDKLTAFTWACRQ